MEQIMIKVINKEASRMTTLGQGRIQENEIYIQAEKEKKCNDYF